MYWNPFDVKTRIPWCILFNIISWSFTWFLNFTIGDNFTNVGRAVICIIFFIPNLVYFIYIVTLNLSLFYKNVASNLKYLFGIEINTKRRLSLWSIIDILGGNVLTWSWLFASIYYFNPNYYQSNLINQPNQFFINSIRFWFFSVGVANSFSYGLIMPIGALIEFFSLLLILETSFIYLVLFSAFVSTANSYTK